MNQNIFGIRIKLARKKAGLSLQELSDLLKNKVTKQALSKYEQGLMNPSSEVLSALSKALFVKPDYFLKKEILELSKISFRKKASLSKKDEDAIVEKARDYVERYLELENILGIAQEFKNPLEGFVIKNKNHVMEAANKLREAWELGNNSIPGLIEILELNGIKIVLIEDVDEIDGFASYSKGGVPIVVVNIRNKPVERIRFTVIHELAHILLNFDKSKIKDQKIIEKFCHYFSSCFLLPQKVLFKMIGEMKRNYIAIKELIAIKEQFGISIRAILHRLMELEVISKNYYKRWMVYLNKEYGPKNEPGSFKYEDGVKVFERLINRALSEELISFSKAAALCNSSVYEIRKEYFSVE